MILLLLSTNTSLDWIFNLDWILFAAQVDVLNSVLQAVLLIAALNDLHSRKK